MTVQVKDNGPSADLQVRLATTRENLEKQVYVSSGYVDGNGSVIFRELLPNYYWYGVDGWDDYGAVEVFSGYDGSVILWLNTPSAPKK